MFLIAPSIAKSASCTSKMAGESSMQPQGVGSDTQVSNQCVSPLNTKMHKLPT